MIVSNGQQRGSAIHILVSNCSTCFIILYKLFPRILRLSALWLQHSGKWKCSPDLLELLGCCLDACVDWSCHPLEWQNRDSRRGKGTLHRMFFPSNLPVSLSLILWKELLGQVVGHALITIQNLKWVNSLLIQFSCHFYFFSLEEPSLFQILLLLLITV